MGDDSIPQNECEQISSKDEPKQTEKNANENNSDIDPNPDRSPNRTESKWIKLMDDDILLKITPLPPKSKRSNKKRTAAVGDAVRVTLIGKTASNGTFQQFQNLIISLGDRDVAPALEMAIRHTPVGRTATVTFRSKYGFGSTGRKGDDAFSPVPPDEDNLRYDFTVHEIANDASYTARAEAQKEIGNDSFRYDNDLGVKALRCWHQGHDMWKEEHKPMEADFGPNYNLGISLCNNMALLHFQRKEYLQTKTACKEVLEKMDVVNLKAWIRLAWAYVMSGDFKEAKVMIEEAKRIGGEGDKDVRKLCVEYSKKKKDSQASVKHFAKNAIKLTPLSQQPGSKKDLKEAVGVKDIFRLVKTGTKGEMKKKPAPEWKEFMDTIKKKEKEKKVSPSWEAYLKPAENETDTDDQSEYDSSDDETDDKEENDEEEMEGNDTSGSAAEEPKNDTWKIFIKVASMVIIIGIAHYMNQHWLESMRSSKLADIPNDNEENFEF